MTAPTPTAATPTPEELAERLRQITETHAKATGGLWYSHGGYLSTRANITHSIYDLDEMGQKTPSAPFQAVPFYSQDDAKFCASAHQDVPWLVDLARAQAAEIARLTSDLDMVLRELAVRTDEAVSAEAALAKVTAEREKDEAVALQLIDQRDTAESAFGKLFAMVTGRPPEWSNLFGYSEALDECEDELSASQERERVMREALERIARSPGGLPDEDDAEGWATLASDRREIARTALKPQATADDR